MEGKIVKSLPCELQLIVYCSVLYLSRRKIANGTTYICPLLKTKLLLKAHDLEFFDPCEVIVFNELSYFSTKTSLGNEPHKMQWHYLGGKYALGGPDQCDRPGLRPDSGYGPNRERRRAFFPPQPLPSTNTKPSCHITFCSNVWLRNNSCESISVNTSPKRSER